MVSLLQRRDPAMRNRSPRRGSTVPYIFGLFAILALVLSFVSPIAEAAPGNSRPQIAVSNQLPDWLSPETAARLNVALVEAYRDALRRRVRSAIDLVTEHISQRRLELLLGLSQGYLSRLRAGNGNPSPELVGHLALIAHDPPARLLELERFWANPEDFPSNMFAPN